MIAELGLAALWLAAALAGLQLLAGALGLRAGGAEIAALVRPAAVGQALRCALAVGALLLYLLAQPHRVDAGGGCHPGCRCSVVASEHDEPGQSH